MTFPQWAAGRSLTVITRDGFNLEECEGAYKGFVSAPMGKVLFADSNGFCLQDSRGGEYFFPWMAVAALEEDCGQTAWLNQKPLSE